MYKVNDDERESSNQFPWLWMLKNPAPSRPWSNANRQPVCEDTSEGHAAPSKQSLQGSLTLGGSQHSS